MSVRFVCLAFLFSLLIFGRPALAETIRLDHNGITLLGDLEGDVGNDRFVLLVHGTLAHKDMELIEALQIALMDRGISSLGITLSLGISEREGMYDCIEPHRHQMSDGNDEIDAWLSWLSGQRNAPLTLLGHSRGGARVAWYVSETPHALVDRIVLIAPAYGDVMSDRLDAYRKRYDSDLGVLIRQARAMLGSGEPEAMIDVPGFLYCPDTQASAAAISSYYDNDERRNSVVTSARVDMPILVIAGSEDTVVREVPTRFRPMAESGKVDLRVIDGADHMFLDFYADDAADLVDEFVPSN